MTLTRADQDAILAPVVMAYAREQGAPRIPVDEPASVRTLASFRAALRLDDRALDDIIARGDHRGPWQSDRCAAGARS
jgi:hypothetical protein